MAETATPDTYTISVHSRPIATGLGHSVTAWEVVENGVRVDGALYTSEEAALASLSREQLLALVLARRTA